MKTKYGSLHAVDKKCLFYIVNSIKTGIDTSIRPAVYGLDESNLPVALTAMRAKIYYDNSYLDTRK